MTPGIINKAQESSAEARPAIEFRDVSLSFGEKLVLNGISFSVPSGEMRIIVGLAKSGKSTILKLAMGLLTPDEGEILIDGVAITSLKEHELFEVRRKFGVMLQTDALFSMSVAENVAYRLIEQGKTLAEAEEEVRSVLRLVGLEHAYDLQPEELSGGMSRRVAFARAVAGEPSIMFYDSPCSGLDPITSRRILRAVLRQRDLYNVTSLYVTNNLDQVSYLSSHFYYRPTPADSVLRREQGELCLINTKVLMLADGKIIFDDVDEKFWKSDDKRIQEFLV